MGTVHLVKAVVSPQPSINSVCLLRKTGRSGHRHPQSWGEREHGWQRQELRGVHSSILPLRGSRGTPRQRGDRRCRTALGGFSSIRRWSRGAPGGAEPLPAAARGTGTEILPPPSRRVLPDSVSAVPGVHEDPPVQGRPAAAAGPGEGEGARFRPRGPAHVFGDSCRQNQGVSGDTWSVGVPTNTLTRGFSKGGKHKALAL